MKMKYYFQHLVVLSSICLVVRPQERSEWQGNLYRPFKERVDLSAPYLRWKNLYSVASNAGMPDLHLQSEYKNGSDIYEACRAFIVEFGKQSSDFIKCTVENARPFRFCEGCVVHYKKAMTVFQDILKNDESMDNCGKILLNADRVQVITSVQKDMDAIWTQADCNNCFESVLEDENATVTYRYKSSTIKFLDLYANFTACVPSNTTVKNSSICDQCRPAYRELNSWFETLRDTVDPEHVCMDIVDMMNYTRLMWGQKLGCTRANPDATPIIVIAVLLFCMPICFYVSMKVYGTRKEKIYMKQKRMDKSKSQYGTTSYASGSGGSFSNHNVIDRRLESITADS